VQVSKGAKAAIEKAGGSVADLPALAPRGRLAPKNKKPAAGAAAKA
jgi:ribosomal protein L18E